MADENNEVVETDNKVQEPTTEKNVTNESASTAENNKSFLQVVKDKRNEAKNDELSGVTNTFYLTKEGIADGGWAVIKGGAGAGCKVIAWGNDALVWACNTFGVDEQAQKFENWSEKYHNKSKEYFNEAGDKAFDCGTNLVASVGLEIEVEKAWQGLKHFIVPAANNIKGIVDEGKNLPERFSSSENENKHFGTDLYTNIENANNNGVPALVDATLETVEGGVNIVKSAGYGTAYCGNKIGEWSCKAVGKVCDIVGYEKGAEACEQRAQDLNEKSKTNAKKCGNYAYNASVNVATAGEQVIQGVVVDPAKWTYKKVDWVLTKTGQYANDLISAEKNVCKAVFNVNDDNKVVQVVDNMGNTIEQGFEMVGDKVYDFGKTLEKEGNNLARKVLDVPEGYQVSGKEYDPITAEEMVQTLGDMPVSFDFVNVKNTLSVTEIERKDAEVKAKQNENSSLEQDGVPLEQSQTEQSSQTNETIPYTEEEKADIKHTMENQYKIHETQLKRAEEKANDVPSNPQIEARVEVHEAEKQQQNTSENENPSPQVSINQNPINQATR